MDNKTERQVDSFAKYLAEDGKRPKTIEGYAGDIAGFLEYINGN